MSAPLRKPDARALRTLKEHAEAYARAFETKCPHNHVKRDCWPCTLQLLDEAFALERRLALQQAARLVWQARKREPTMAGSAAASRAAMLLRRLSRGERP